MRWGCQLETIKDTAQPGMLNLWGTWLLKWNFSICQEIKSLVKFFVAGNLWTEGDEMIIIQAVHSSRKSTEDLGDGLSPLSLGSVQKAHTCGKEKQKLGSRLD